MEGKYEEFAEFPMHEGLEYGLKKAAEYGCHLRLCVYNTDIRRWDSLGFLHPDWTQTDCFGVRYRWTGDPFRRWEKTDLEPYDPIKSKKS